MKTHIEAFYHYFIVQYLNECTAPWNNSNTYIERKEENKKQLHKLIFEYKRTPIINTSIQCQYIQLYSLYLLALKLFVHKEPEKNVS